MTKCFKIKGCLYVMYIEPARVLGMRLFFTFFSVNYLFIFIAAPISIILIITIVISRILLVLLPVNRKISLLNSLLDFLKALTCFFFITCTVLEYIQFFLNISTCVHRKVSSFLHKAVGLMRKTQKGVYKDLYLEKTIFPSHNLLLQYYGEERYFSS